MESRNMSIADELQLLINTKEQMREALGLDIDGPFSQYPVIAESKKVEVVQTTGQSTTKVMSQKAVADALDDKVDKVAGKQLSDKNYTLDEKNKLSGIAVEATKNRADSLNADKEHTHT